MKRSEFIREFYLYFTLFTVFVLSIIIAPYYIYGDQKHYIGIYNGLLNLSVYEGYNFYITNIDSKEPVYFLLAWASSNLGIDKTYFVSFFNTVLAYFSYRYLIKLGGHPLIAYIIISFSYYSFVLFFAAERLKFGFIFLLIALMSSRKIYFFYILSILAHAQMIIVATSAIATKVKNDIYTLLTKLRVSREFLFFISIATFGVFVITLLMYEHLSSKLDSYFGLRNIVELSKLSLFFSLSLYYAKSKKEVFAFFLPLFFFTLIFGGERVNFIGYFAFLYFSISYKKGFNLGVLSTLLYFSYAGFNFLSNIIKLGNGFAQSYNVL